MRMSAQSVWLIRPHLKDPNSIDVPSLHHPYFPEEDDTLDRVAAIEAARKQLQDGRSLNRKTRDFSND